MAQVTVANIPPTLTLSGSATSATNAAYTLTLAHSDPGPDTISGGALTGAMVRLSSTPTARCR